MKHYYGINNMSHFFLPVFFLLQIVIESRSRLHVDFHVWYKNLVIKKLEIMETVKICKKYF